ncbi:DUF6711 family protein [Clostridium gasigenes]|uniref:Uncharacterized protein n=1 Tax=Clostridium gasigenes TaxID=94869 RepID=A0A7X0VSW8_9CLOT|nr:DUF6711 family protein [Clostridium gasigenes]MBB6716373.1 hypothetical protein [Clostridium gasigenes]
MALININGVNIPTPSDYKIGIMDINKAERNARGDMIIERITTKRKIELAWKYLSKEDLSNLFNLVSGTFFSVNYIDPQDGADKSGAFYAGDRSSGALDFMNGVIRYKDIKFNLIER